MNLLRLVLLASRCEYNLKKSIESLFDHSKLIFVEEVPLIELFFETIKILSDVRRLGVRS